VPCAPGLESAAEAIDFLAIEPPQSRTGGHGQFLRALAVAEQQIATLTGIAFGRIHQMNQMHRKVPTHQRAQAALVSRRIEAVAQDDSQAAPAPAASKAFQARGKIGGLAGWVCP
jgi:hypothetical protein